MHILTYFLSFNFGKVRLNLSSSTNFPSNVQCTYNVIYFACFNTKQVTFRCTWYIMQDRVGPFPFISTHLALAGTFHSLVCTFFPLSGNETIVQPLQTKSIANFPNPFVWFCESAISVVISGDPDPERILIKIF